MIGFLVGSAVVATYIIATIIFALVAQRLFSMSGEALRKTLHFIFLGAYIPLISAFEVWWHAAIFAALLIALVPPFLAILNRVRFLSVLLVERSRGEYFGSMLLALFMMLISVCVCWGIMGDRYLVIACIYAWGVGDGFAALVGVRFGRHKIKWRLADPHKNLEGSITMLGCSFISVFSVLLIRGGLSVDACMIIAALGSVGCTVSELCAKNGLDNLICPSVAMIIILPLVRLFGV